MITPLSTTKNEFIYLISNFFWNLGRTVPHAILTIMLLEYGLTLAHVGILQLIYMLVSVIFEVPSGIIADHFSRKKLYIISVILILCSYYLIYISMGNFIFLGIAWGIYGLSAALKSGTIENDIVLEIRDNSERLKKFTYYETLLTNVSSILGALIGSLFYEGILKNIYLFTFAAFIISVLIALQFDETLVLSDVKGIKKEKVFSKKNWLFLKNKNILIAILAFSILAIVSQPLFQYWQVVYKFKNIDVYYFGIVYMIFQFMNIVGAYVYEKISNKKKLQYFLILSIIPLILVLMFTLTGTLFFVFFPFVLIPFYFYSQNVTVYIRKVAPPNQISSFTSVIELVMSLSSFLVLGLIVMVIDVVPVSDIYVFCFSLFALFAIICMHFMSKNPKI